MSGPIFGFAYVYVFVLIVFHLEATASYEYFYSIENKSIETNGIENEDIWMLITCKFIICSDTVL